MISRNEIFDELHEIVLDYLGEDDIHVSEDSSLTEDLNLSSLDLMSIVGDVEDSFGITVEDEDMSGMDTVGDVIDYVADKKRL